MGDRAHVHITIGGTLPRELLPELIRRAQLYDLRTEWDGDSFDDAALTSEENPYAGKPLDLYGMELNGGLTDDVDAFCIEHGLVFHRWSGGCPGAFNPEIVVFDGSGPLRDYSANEDGDLLFSPQEIAKFSRMRDLKRAIALAQIMVPPFVLV